MRCGVIKFLSPTQGNDVMQVGKDKAVSIAVASRNISKCLPAITNINAA